MESKNNQYFYRGNKTINQDYLPECARRNRKPKSFLVEFPQGDDDFSRSKKKQYSILHNQSEIRDSEVMILEKQKYFEHNNLSVKDIDGATPNMNNHMSEALKNRLKGLVNRAKIQKYIPQNERVQFNSTLNQKLAKIDPNLAPLSYSEQNREKICNMSSFERFKTKFESPSNYHFSQNSIKVQTQPSEYDLPLFQKQKQSSNTTTKKHSRHHTLDYKGTEKPPSIKNKDQYANIHKNTSIQAAIDPEYQKNNKSVSQIKNLYHGDTSRIRLIPKNMIRKYNPTYLSTIKPMDHWPTSPNLMENPEGSYGTLKEYYHRD